ncbi:MAG: hypothetical protein L0I80_07995 [Brevibacterium sp.]|uniref:hypothetical protein n=1 Tax=Brevibacterium sp. TaxID=1701 RepID=UPI00264959E7|nr:hypothetical protein [Brevibacterium sp.]MDN5806052.1 hypothetical protein [Brevibacterium sp.]MDN5832561.1 hypothetical protein [Brevibacterium sp.]MDN5875192.1 hypothetical protein [Brevibacterium sp.]MDN5908247.1 hypothetical protein [Brevibacterium sp.]MDN6123793.1 hypothetical protein [Brevibacterium sp.]
MDLSIIARTGGPVLFWRGPDFDRLDLTGPVAANWVNKGVGLFGDYDLGPDFTLFVPMPAGLHWRELVAILSVLLADGRVVLGSATSDSGAKDAAAPDGDFHAFVPLGHENDERLTAAEEIFVYNPPALALSTPVDEDFIDVNSAIRAYPDVTPRRLQSTGTLIVGDQEVQWGDQEVQWTESPNDSGSGILVANSTPLPDEWATFLGHLLRGGETLLANGMDEVRIADLASSLGEVRGRLGTWTK